jgi:hypothetical protein
VYHLLKICVPFTENLCTIYLPFKDCTTLLAVHVAEAAAQQAGPRAAAVLHLGSWFCASKQRPGGSPWVGLAPQLMGGGWSQRTVVMAPCLATEGSRDASMCTIRQSARRLCTAGDTLLHAADSFDVSLPQAQHHAAPDP